MSHMQPDYEDDSEIEEEELSDFTGSENSDEFQESEDELDAIAPQLIQPVQIDQNLLSHPIFNYSDDFFLKTLGQILRPLLKTQPYTENLPQKLEQFQFFLFQSIFGNQSIANIKTAFQKLGLTEKTTCGKVLSAKTGIAFRCLDCEPPDNGSGLTSIMCSECFEKSNHKGHRVYVERLTKANTAFCDCGDSETLKPEGFCPEHTSNQVDRDEELGKFPQDLLKNCQDCLRKAFYAGICIFEVAERLPLGACRNAFVSFGQRFVDQVLGFVQNGYTEINSAFILVLSSLLESKFQSPFNQVWHNCDNLTPETAELDPKEHACKCTLTSALLRYAPFIETEIQSRFKKVLMECMQDVKYRDFMTHEFVKYIKFLFPTNYIKDDIPHPENSHLVTLNFILCGTEPLALKVIESPHFMHYVDIIQSTIRNYEKGDHKLEKAAYYFEDFMNWFINPAYKSVSERIMHNTTFTKDLLEVLATFERKYLYKDQISLTTQDFQVNHRQIIKSFDVQSRLFKGIIHNLKYIINCEKENQHTLFQNVAQEWYKYFLESQQEQQDTSSINLNLSLERILAFILRSYQDEVAQSGVETFFKTFLPEVKLELFSQQILKNVQKAVGIFRFITILRDPEWAHLGRGYYFFHYLYLEMDIALSQMMILLASPENLFETLTESFFSYNQDLQDFCKNPIVVLKEGEEDFKNKEAVLKDFLQLLVYLMTDELCLMNLNSKLRNQEQIDSDPHRERVVQKAVINLLLGSYWIDILFVKDNLANKLLSNDSRVNKIIQKVTILNEKDRKIRVKDEYECELDPYIFAKAPLLQSEMVNEYASRAQKNSKLDLVGGKSYDDLQSYLYNIQQKLFQSSLPLFLKKLILNASSSSKEIYPLIPLALKLVLMNLEFNARHRVEQNILTTTEFIQKLQELSKVEDLKDCKLALQKIQEIVGGGFNQETPDNSADLKKKAAQEKMNKIKEEFAKKQALFADKNKEESPDTSSPEKSTQEDIICQHCLARVDENNETYGIPVYVGFSNNLYDAEPEFKHINYNELDKAKWWPVFSSCHHYYHEKCFSVMCAGLADDQTLFGGLTRYYCCSLCKNLCNHLLLLNSQESKPIVQTIRERLAALIATLVDLPGFMAPDLSSKFLFNRTHQYFTETFHLHNQPESLEKSLELYVALFKNLKTGLEPLLEPLDFSDKAFLLKLAFSHIKYLATSPPNLAMLYTFMHYKLDNILGFVYSNGLMESAQPTESYLNFLKQYLQIRSIQTVIESQQKGPLTLNQCLTVLKDDTSLIQKISKEYLFPIQKTILAIALIQPSKIKMSRLCNLLCHPQEATPEYITQLFQTLNISKTFEAFMSESILELEEAINLPEFLRLDALLAKLGPQKLKRSPVLKLAPRHVELPETFPEFNNQYQCQKCSICHQYNRNKQLIVCLICGQIMCSGSCSGHESKQKKTSGNANKHANESHFGSSVFQSIFDNVWIFIDAPLNIVSIPKDVYIDAIGQPILDILEESSQIEKINFKEYQLNQNFSDEFKRIINHHEFNKEIRRVVLQIEDPNDQVGAILGELGNY